MKLERQKENKKMAIIRGIGTQETAKKILSAYGEFKGNLFQISYGGFEVEADLVFFNEDVSIRINNKPFFLSYEGLWSILEEKLVSLT